MSLADKVFWLALLRFCSGWKSSLIIVTPQTVIRWHRSGFRIYWAYLSRRQSGIGRRPLSKDIRSLIQRMAADNPTWGAPRTQGELLMLGFNVSERSVSRWVKKCHGRPDPAKQRITSLKNHRDSISAMDFFTVPTLTFGVLYCLFVIGHDHRRVLHDNVTRNPSEFWTALQLMQTWQFEAPCKFLIFDRDAKFSREAQTTMADSGVKSVRTAFRSRWQNRVTECWVGSIRRKLLDHVIVMNERHLRPLVRDYVRCYNEDRTHLSLAKQTPVTLTIAQPTRASAKIVALPRSGGVPHRYETTASITRFEHQVRILYCR